MATLTSPSINVERGELRFVVNGVDWDGYEALLKIMPKQRMTYDRGTVEFMSPLFIHEHYVVRLRKLVECIAEELDIAYLPAGSTTFRRKAEERGLEPDECFYFASAARIRTAADFDLEVNPPPDLAIEVEITNSSLNKLKIYAAIGVPEVWRFDGESLFVYVLQINKTYLVTEVSPSLPFVPLDDVPELLLDPDVNNMGRWAKKVRAWVRSAVLPRRDEQPREPTLE